eukprot:Sspe_Gene.77351::Locus_48322_Transcript_1_1_Confidence_1.000_Length_2516::g.77351::m.77351
MGNCHTMDETDQLVMQRAGCDRRVRNGLGWTCTGPMTKTSKRKAVVLHLHGYAVIHNPIVGERRMIKGPQIYYLRPQEEVVSSGEFPTLAPNEWISITNTLTGEYRYPDGPGVVEFSEYETCGNVYKSRYYAESLMVKDLETGRESRVQGPYSLMRGEYVRILHKRSGQVRTMCGPRRVTIRYDEVVLGKPLRLPVLEVGEYCVLHDKGTAGRRVVHGPCLMELGEMEEVEEVGRHTVLVSTQYCRVRDKTTGEERIECGPKVLALEIQEEMVGEPATLPVLPYGEYARIRDEGSGVTRVVCGPCTVQLGRHDRVVATDVCPNLSRNEYIAVRNEADGSIRNVVGPALFLPGPFDTWGEVRVVVGLRNLDYIKVLSNDGSVRVERGEQLLIPNPLDTVLGEVQRAVLVDEHHAVLVRNTDSGGLELVTRPGPFFPGPYQEVVEVQEKIVLEKSEVVVCKDPSGGLYYAAGNPELPSTVQGPGPAFFLPPYHEVVHLPWEGAEGGTIWKLDLRPRTHTFSIECRTVDNVPLHLDVAFTWHITDVPRLVEGTSNAPRDIGIHVRTSIQREVAKTKLVDFLATCKVVVQSAALGDGFYSGRGIGVLLIDVLTAKCSSDGLRSSLEEVAHEACTLAKAREKQQGENELALQSIAGEIQIETKRNTLIEVKKSHLCTEALIEGEAEGIRIEAFLSCVGHVVGCEAALRVFRTMQEQQARVGVVRAAASGGEVIVLPPRPHK